MNPPVKFAVLGYLPPQSAIPVATDTLIPWGVLVAQKADGTAVVAADSPGLTIAGVSSGTAGGPRNDAEADNRGRIAGAVGITLLCGFFRYRNSRAAPVTTADLGKTVFVEDERTIARNTTNNLAAGVAMGLETVGDTAPNVWVFVGPPGTLPGTRTIGDAAGGTP